jgi:hypothetical protein
MTIKVKNVSETCEFPASSLVGSLTDLKAAVSAKFKSENPDSTDKDSEVNFEEFRKASVAFSRNKYPDIQAELEDNLRSFFDEQYLKTMESLGARTPAESIQVSMSLASLVFDLYVNTVVAPTAPLAKAIFQSKVNKLAESMDSEEVSFDAETLKVIRKPLEDEAMWEKLNLTGRINVNGETRYLQLSTMAMSFFSKTLGSVLGLFGIEEGNSDGKAG